MLMSFSKILSFCGVYSIEKKTFNGDAFCYLRLAVPVILAPGRHDCKIKISFFTQS